METKDATLIRRPFIRLLIDAIRLTLLSGEQDDVSQQRTFAGAAIMNCVFAVECAANCILQYCRTSQKFREEIDKLSSLLKFEFLLVIYGKKLDRGSKEVQGIQELINLRNHYVHPKTKQFPMTYSNDGSMPTFNLKAEPKLTNNLRIPLHPMGWNSQQCCNGSKSIDRIFKFFLCNSLQTQSQRGSTLSFSRT